MSTNVNLGTLPCVHRDCFVSILLEDMNVDVMLLDFTDSEMSAFVSETVFTQLLSLTIFFFENNIVTIILLIYYACIDKNKQNKTYQQNSQAGDTSVLRLYKRMKLCA